MSIYLPPGENQYISASVKSTLELNSGHWLAGRLIVAMNWARRLKRVFGIELESCTRCGGKLEVIARIEEPQIIAKILAHLERAAPQQCPTELPLGARAPPVQSRLL